MALADPDLRHGMAAAFLRHFRAPLGLEVDADLLDRHALREQQPLRRLAEGARRGGVHQNPALHFSTGKPACCHAFKPPLRFTTRVNPCFLSAATAFDERSPASSYTMSGFSLRLARSAGPWSRRASGMFLAPSTWPVPYSPGSRTSTTSASSRLMRCVACAGVTHGPPALRRKSGHSSIAPEMKATAKRRRLLRTKSTRGDNYNRAMRKLVLLRHGESDWNRENRFTGWTDVDLSAKGVTEARDAGKLLKAEGYAFDIAYTSMLKRAIRTLWIALEELGQMWLPEVKDWRLNERHYGDLQGLDKAEMAAKFGEQQVLAWRRSYDTPPPALKADDARYEGRDPRYAGVKVPRTECLKDTVARVVPYWESTIAPSVRSGQRVLIAAHGNSLRALVKYLDDIPDEKIVKENIPTGMPLVYELDDQLKPLKRYYLGDPAEVARRVASVAAQGKAKV